MQQLGTNALHPDMTDLFTGDNIHPVEDLEFFGSQNSAGVLTESN